MPFVLFFVLTTVCRMYTMSEEVAKKAKTTEFDSDAYFAKFRPDRESRCTWTRDSSVDRSPHTHSSNTCVFVSVFFLFTIRFVYDDHPLLLLFFFLFFFCRNYSNGICPTILHAIGHTPLVKLNRIPLAEGVECEIRKCVCSTVVIIIKYYR